MKEMIDITAFVLFAAFCAVLLGIPVYIGWNWALIDAIPAAGLAKISIWQAIGIAILLQCGRGGGGSSKS